MNRAELIKKIKREIRLTLSEARGVIINSFEGQEVGIDTYHYDILTEEGFYSGFWTEKAPQLTEDEIICNITDSEECEYWEDMEAEDLRERLQMLLSSKGKNKNQ